MVERKWVGEFQASFTTAQVRLYEPNPADLEKKKVSVFKTVESDRWVHLKLL